LRVHGRNKASWFARDVGRDAKYDYLYTTSEVGELTERVRRLAGSRDETYVITNNHFQGKAVANALEILADLRGNLVPAPAEIVRSYPRLSKATRIVDARPRTGQQELF
jgi:uncharacterized protein YecE (DUF72 family)